MRSEKRNIDKDAVPEDNVSEYVLRERVIENADFKIVRISLLHEIHLFSNCDQGNYQPLAVCVHCACAVSLTVFAYV